MNQPRVYLETMGCQMNQLDSELVMGQLHKLGYRRIDSMADADLVLLNTCSVRAHAEDKVYSRLGELRAPRSRRPDMIVGVIGCMAERDHDGICRKMPHVDLLCGPGELNRIPELLEEVKQSRQRVIALADSQSRKTKPADRASLYDSIEGLDLSREPSPDTPVLQSYVRVQRGCDKFCTFCVVPFTRGPERSRPPSHIVQETRMLADRGAKEITLLGQTVNSYVHQENGRIVRFADLLHAVNEVPGIERIRFVTSYPGDFTDDIFQAMRDLPKMCEYLHIPVQAGSNAVLQRMKRQYTVESYIELMDRARQYVPNIAIATDFIVGFCGETEEDFAETLDLLDRVQFSFAFCFKYSPRPNTAADRRLADDVPDEVKRRRHAELTAKQHEISLNLRRALIGQTVEVLVEGYSKAALKAQEAEQTRGEEISWRKSKQLVGRTRRDEIVVFEGDCDLIGSLASVRIIAATPLTLHGVPAGSLGAEAAADRSIDRRFALPISVIAP